MARYLPVAPANYLDHFSRRDHIGHKSAFLLAHEVVKDPEGYFQLHQNWRLPTGDRSPMDFSILDNSVIELGGTVDIQLMNEAIYIAKPTVAVFPDALEDCSATLEHLHAAWDSWSAMCRDRPHPIDRMVVPQGETLKDWVLCLESIRDFAIPEWIGIPRNTPGRIVASRRDLIEYTRVIFPQVKIHLLGFSDYVWDDVISANHPAVTSIDSAVPVRVERFTMTGKVPPRGDWWEHASKRQDIPDYAGNNARKTNTWVGHY